MPSSSQVAFVSGGGSGIGRACALAFARAGRAVMIADADRAAAAAVAKEISEAGGRAVGVAVDVSDEMQVRDAVAATVAEFGRLDSAVNSAGIQGEMGPTGECSTANWERTLAVNLTGTFLCMREQIAVMLGRETGSIVNISSNFGLVGKKGIPAYCASKHGVIGLSKSAALDYAAMGIRINVVCPGPTTTPMFDKIVEQSGDRARAMLQEVEDNVPMARLGRPEDIASAVLWLCSDAAAFVTGAAIPVDGGFVIG